MLLAISVFVLLVLLVKYVLHEILHKLWMELTVSSSVDVTLEFLVIVVTNLPVKTVVESLQCCLHSMVGAQLPLKLTLHLNQNISLLLSNCRRSAG